MPIGILVCGPSGVGKSSHFQEMLDNAGVSEKITLFDPDQMSDETHEKRSMSALEAVKDAIQSGKSFGYPATCGSLKVTHDLIKRMKAKKYRIIIAIVYTSLPVALERIRKRTHQPVPDDVVEDLHAFFKKKAEMYMNLPVELYLYNNETQFNLLLSKKAKKIVCRDSTSDFFFDLSKHCGSA